jgi:predicted NUDIX family NTP pyrophosphohydrolase
MAKKSAGILMYKRAADTLLVLLVQRQRGGKLVTAFALEGDFDVGSLQSNVFEIEWPPRSGRMQSFPEVDNAEWFPLPLTRQKIIASQRPFLDRLESMWCEHEEPRESRAGSDD